MKKSLLVLMVIAQAAATGALGPSDADVNAAIKAGLSGAKTPGTGCRAGGGFGSLKGFDITASGPLNRITEAAKDAKAKYLPFTIDAVTQEMRSDRVIVTAAPQIPEYNNVGHFWDEARPATHLVLKSHVPKGIEPVVLQPASVQLVPTQWANMMGGTRTGQGVTATFSLGEFASIPTKEIDVTVVMSDRGERTCTIKANDRQAIK